MGDRIPEWAVIPDRTGHLYLEVVPPPGSAPSIGNGRWCVDQKAGYLLGRNADAVDVPVDHISASRVHACLAHDSTGGVHLLDLSSVHGTFLNGVRLEKGGKVLVKDGDIIRIAACSLEYRLAVRPQPQHLRKLPFSDTRSSQASPRAGITGRSANAKVQQGQDRGDAQLPAERDAVRDRSGDRRYNDRDSIQNIGREAANNSNDGRSDYQSNRRSDQGRNDREYEQRSDRTAQPRSDAHRQPLGGDSSAPDHLRDGGGRSGGQHQERLWGNNGSGGGNWQPGDRRGGVGRPERGGDGENRSDQNRGYHKRTDKGGAGRGSSPADREKGRTSRSPTHKRRNRDDRSQQEVPRRHRFSGADESGDANPQAKPAGVPVPTPAQHQAAAAATVRQMMGGGAAWGGPTAVEQKKKLLWGSKKVAQPDPLGPAQAAVFGTNRWDAAEFGSDADKAKFQRLMGVKQVPTVAPRPSQEGPSAREGDPAVFTKEGQSKVLSELESQFLAGVRRGGKQTYGLGVL